MGRGAEVAEPDLRALRVEHRGLDAAAKQGLGVAREEPVEPVRSGHVERESLTAPAGSSPLLAQARDGAGEPDGDRAVEQPDVDPELERVGRRHAEELARDEIALDRTALLGGVARAIGREPERQVGASCRLERLAGDPEHDLDATAAAHEADRPQARGRERREQARRLGERRPALARLVVEQGRLPEGDGARGARGPVLRHDGHLETRQRTRQLDGVPDRRRGEQERRRRSVQRAHAAQPPQDERHVAAEDTAVDVCLVDDDVREAAKHLGPARVVREDPEVQHVRVREDRVAPLARERSSLAWRVPVVERRPQTEAQLRQPPRLILGERLRRAEVQGPRAAALEQLLHEGERVGERLAARRPRDDADVPAGARELVGLGLVRVELGDALCDQRGRHARIDVRGQRDDARERPGLVGAMHEPVVVRGRPDREQRLPGLLFAGRRRHRRTLPNVGSAAVAPELRLGSRQTG